MTLQQGLAFGLVGLTVAAFIWGRFRYDLVALAALIAGLAIGVIPADAAFEGFRVVRRHPIVTVAWGLVYLAVYVAMFGLGADKWASLMAAGKVDKVMVGADRICANGDFANKVGTYMLAVAAHYHQVPFYVVAPYTTVDPACATGAAIPIEQRDGAEVRGAAGAFGEVVWAPSDAPVWNPAFDVTPASLVTAWILDTGVFDAAAIAQGEHLRGWR